MRWHHLDRNLRPLHRPTDAGGRTRGGAPIRPGRLPCVARWILRREPPADEITGGRHIARSCRHRPGPSPGIIPNIIANIRWSISIEPIVVISFATDSLLAPDSFAAYRTPATGNRQTAISSTFGRHTPRVRTSPPGSDPTFSACMSGRPEQAAHRRHRSATSCSRAESSAGRGRGYRGAGWRAT